MSDLDHSEYVYQIFSVLTKFESEYNNQFDIQIESIVFFLAKASLLFLIFLMRSLIISSYINKNKNLKARKLCE